MQLENATSETKKFVNSVLKEVREKESAKGILDFTKDIEKWNLEAL